MAAERDDGGSHQLDAVEPAVEPLRLLDHDRLPEVGLPASRGERLGHDLREVVDVVDEHAVEIPRARIDVPRHGEVDEEE